MDEELTAKYSGDSAEKERPPRNEKVCKEGIVYCRNATHILQNVVSMTLYNIGWSSARHESVAIRAGHSCRLTKGDDNEREETTD